MCLTMEEVNELTRLRRANITASLIVLEKLPTVVNGSKIQNLEQ